jgi:hypothetical protein
MRFNFFNQFEFCQICVKNSTNFNETDITKSQHDLTKYLHSSSTNSVSLHFPFFQNCALFDDIFLKLRNFIHSLLIFSLLFATFKKNIALKQ